jgi:26S proteasome regulatory subunit T6
MSAAATTLIHENIRPLDNSVKVYYRTKNEEAQQLLKEKLQNVRRLQAQRNELNNKVRMLKEELVQLHEQGSYVGEVSKVMDKKKILVKVSGNCYNIS